MISFLDGKVSAVIGTHTHVQTSDERIYPNGTAYITDVGMTGPYDSVIGMKTQAAINRFLFRLPKSMKLLKMIFTFAVFLKVDTETGKA
jgi:2',3'-cyclic-nucleotide 2'-phosphodiesterase